MSNPVFYAADMSAAAFTMSLAEDASYPLSNLHTNIPTLLWKSSAATNVQTLKIDLGVAKACDFLAIGTHNWAGMTTVNLQYDTADNPAFTSLVDLIPTANGFTANFPQLITFTSATKRYWRVLFTNCNSVVPQAGLVLLGAKLTFPHTYDWDFNLGDKQYNTTKATDINGVIRTARSGGGRGVHKFKLSLTDDTFRTDWQALCEKTFGSANPFVWTDDVAVKRISHFAEDYLPISKHRYNITDLLAISLIDQSI
jgi:hypothetical protein